ncbi:hypothetical protein [Bradyrhizobium sp. Tv2a-2]|uniref:hypothetical protein n=1 Tax=Bradyrhizobium sp. Tv2a-2 TaxID=113395 RepID=UPI0018DEA9CB|nr:hypothetical protein [Bradyrhizobium sp. Tv2a-2]
MQRLSEMIMLPKKISKRRRYPPDRIPLYSEKYRFRKINHGQVKSLPRFSAVRMFFRPARECRFCTGLVNIPNTVNTIRTIMAGRSSVSRSPSTVLRRR